jgi:LPS sulfotransferase NodH
LTTRGYVSCSYPRSGSNYLCQLLASTGQLGYPQDWFNGPGVRAREDADYPLEPRAQLRQVLARGTTANGVYGLKMFCGRLDDLAGLDWAGALPSLHWIHLERCDLLGQAISNVRSDQTRQFRSTARARTEPYFDHGAIRASLTQIARDQGRWKLFFARNTITPLHLTYETIAADAQVAVDAVARLMRLEQTPTVQIDRVTLAIQRDAISEEWRERFLSAERDLGRLDALHSPIVPRARRRLTHFLRRIAG